MVWYVAGGNPLAGLYSSVICLASLVYAAVPHGWSQNLITVPLPPLDELFFLPHATNVGPSATAPADSPAYFRKLRRDTPDVNGSVICNAPSAVGEGRVAGTRGEDAVYS